MKQYNTDFPDDIFNINQATEEDLESGNFEVAA